MTWGIFTPEGELDTDPEPMVFSTRREALECLQEYGPGYYVAEILDTVKREQFTARISATGTSLNINCTKQVRRMGLDRGDLVRVTLERVEE